MRACAVQWVEDARGEEAYTQHLGLTWGRCLSSHRGDVEFVCDCVGPRCRGAAGEALSGVAIARCFAQPGYGVWMPRLALRSIAALPSGDAAGEAVPGVADCSLPCPDVSGLAISGVAIAHCFAQTARGVWMTPMASGPTH
ncbi:uncharacterized protein EMH_0060620 [Eimeria mitis]|uniref:Uncharacterized protein n=1 Tax=Eimeria mitis TaxID=44415 RepID=U6K4M1_9EIME|nr:uncharacterized protein EMH_0060620 [Eimeria mitis]CDJ30703.1 hypothetical protein EMH_0060620 [Eimeria mitis]